MRVLLVEDDTELRGAVERRLRRTGFAVDAVIDIAAAETALGVHEYDCLVLDRTVPDGDTITLVRRLRDIGRHMPALFLTARDAVRDRIDGFEAGGDDYLIKPFAMDELVARVRALCRSHVRALPTILKVGDLSINSARAEVRRGTVLLPLTAKELCVLGVLAAGVGSIVTRSDLINTCWDEHTDPMSNTVDVHVASLRRKLGEPALIRTVRGAGYVLEPPDAV